MTDITLTLYSDIAGAIIASGLPFPGLPYPGLVIVTAGTVWQVLRVQVLIAEPGSVAARQGDPLHADVIVTPAEGIHK